MRRWGNSEHAYELSPPLEEITVKTALTVTAVFALAASLAVAPAQAKHHRHHHKHHMSMGSTSGPSGPGQDAGAPDKSRPAGKGVSRRPAD